MKTSKEILNIAGAFIKAQTGIGAAIKNAENPYFKSDYADLSAVIEACKKELNRNSIAVLQPIRKNFVETILMHVSGEWFSSMTPIVCKTQNDPQALGSAITYARRYGLQSMVLLPAKDDDGNEASEDKPTAQWQINRAFQLYKDIHGKEAPEKEKAKVKTLSSNKISELINKMLKEIDDSAKGEQIDMDKIEI
jgi:hypothetical protein